MISGKGRYSLRTVYDPYPWHGKGDVVVVGVSDASDATRAAAAVVRPEDLKRVDIPRLFIKWPDAVTARTTATEPPGIIVPVRKLWQRWSRHLAKRESVELANLLYTDVSTAPADLHIRRVGPGAVVIEGAEPVLLAIRGAQAPGLAFDAEMVYVSPSTLAWAKGSELRIGSLAARSVDGVCDAELDLRTGKSLGKAKVEARGLTPDAVRKWLSSLKAGRAALVKAQEACPAAKRLWSRALDASSPVQRIRLADLDQDGQPEILVAAGRDAAAFSANGERLWSYATASTCNDVAAGELTRTPGLEVVDGHLSTRWP